MQQEQIHKTETRRKDAPADAVPVGVDAAKLKAELDALLDEIDEVLEENAAEFVRDYVQKGGE